MRTIFGGERSLFFAADDFTGEEVDVVAVFVDDDDTGVTGAPEQDAELVRKELAQIG